MLESLGDSETQKRRNYPPQKIVLGTESRIVNVIDMFSEGD